MRKVKVYSGGGAAAVAPPLTFLGCPETSEETAHLHKPTRMQLKFSKKSPKDELPYNLEDKIHSCIPSVEITIEVTQNDKCFKILVDFKSPEDLEKSKSLLKTFQFLSTSKGKTSNWKPEVSVVQPKKGEQKEKSAADDEDFPLGIFGDEHLASVQPMQQRSHRFLLLSIKSRLGPWMCGEKEWGNLAKLPVYQSLPVLEDSYICVPHPNNPESHDEIVQMQQKGIHTDRSKNWTFRDFVWVPKKILEIHDYWKPNWNTEEIIQPAPATLIAPLVSCHGSLYPAFNPVEFLESLGEHAQVSVVPPQCESQALTSFWLRDDVIDAIFHIDEHGQITSLKLRFAQMIQVSAYWSNPSKNTLCDVTFRGFETRVARPRSILIMHPTQGRRMPSYNYIGKVLIPWQFLRMPQVWVSLKMSDTFISGI